MHPPKHLLLLGAALVLQAAAYAQSIGPSAIDAAGSSGIAGGNTFEYAIGQVAAGNTFTGSSLVVTPGVLQPAATTGVPGLSIAGADLQVYPSPAQQRLYLQPAFSGGGTLQCALYDALGKLVLSQEARLLSGKERQTLMLDAIAAGQYTLQVQWLQAGATYSAGYKIQKLAQ